MLTEETGKDETGESAPCTSLETARMTAIMQADLIQWTLSNRELTADVIEYLMTLNNSLKDYLENIRCLKKQ